MWDDVVKLVTKSYLSGMNATNAVRRPSVNFAEIEHKARRSAIVNALSSALVMFALLFSGWKLFGLQKELVELNVSVNAKQTGARWD